MLLPPATGPAAALLHAGGPVRDDRGQGTTALDGYEPLNRTSATRDRLVDAHSSRLMLAGYRPTSLRAPRRRVVRALVRRVPARLARETLLPVQEDAPTTVGDDGTARVGTSSDTASRVGQRWAPSRPAQLALAVAFCVLLMGAVVTVTAVADRIPNTGYLLRDTTALLEVPWWVGSVSRFTNLLWAVTAAVNVLASLLTPPAHRWRQLHLGVLIGVLAVDDTFLLHDAALTAQGVPEGVVLAGYAVAGVLLAWAWRPVWRTPIGLAFFGGATLLGLSVALDVVFSNAYVLEDGTKLLGVLVWLLCGVWAFLDAASGSPRSELRG